MNILYKFILSLCICVISPFILTGCLSTFGVSVLKVDSRSPEQIYAATELQKVKAGIYQAAVLPDGSIDTNKAGVGFMGMGQEQWSRLLDAFGMVKGEASFLSFDWTVKSEDPQVLRHERISSDNKTQEVEYRSLGTVNNSQQYPPAYDLKK